MDLRFRLWLEDTEMRDSDSMRRTILGYLDLKLNPKEGIHTELANLDLKYISDKLDGWSYFQNLPDSNKQGVKQILLLPLHKNIKDLMDAMLQPNLGN